jgi:hypothetical protein
MNMDKFIQMLVEFGKLGREGKVQLDAAINHLKIGSEEDTYAKEALAWLADLAGDYGCE